MGGPVLGSPANAIRDSPWREMQRALAGAEAQAEEMFDPLVRLLLSVPGGMGRD